MTFNKCLGQEILRKPSRFTKFEKTEKPFKVHISNGENVPLTLYKSAPIFVKNEQASLLRAVRLFHYPP
jgi:hypothetical protein